jgi:hypothetical protein
MLGTICGTIAASPDCAMFSVTKSTSKNLSFESPITLCGRCRPNGPALIPCGLRNVGKLWGDFGESRENQMLNTRQNLFVEIVDTRAGHCRQPSETAETIRMINHLMASPASLRTEQIDTENRERARNIPHNRGEPVGKRSTGVPATNWVIALNDL